MVRARFLYMRQMKMAMRDYVQMARHLASCITTHPMDMYTQVSVIVDGMREGKTRLSLSVQSLPHWRRHLRLPSAKTSW